MLRGGLVKRAGSHHDGVCRCPEEPHNETVRFVESADIASLAAQFAGKVVFVGVTANSQIDDRLFTPFGMTPGTEINAAAFETMAQGTFLIDVEPLWENLVVLGLLAAIGLAFRYLPGWWAYGTGGLLLLGATLIPYVFFIHQRVFPFATSFLVAWLGTLIGREQV